MLFLTRLRCICLCYYAPDIYKKMNIKKKIEVIKNYLVLLLNLIQKSFHLSLSNLEVLLRSGLVNFISIK